QERRVSMYRRCWTLALAVLALGTSSLSAARAQYIVLSLHPAGFKTSDVSGISGSQQVGSGCTTNETNFHALLWNGSASSYVDLHPAGFSRSYATGTSGSQQAGFGYLNGDTTHPRPLLWSGTASSYIDLTPAGFTGGIIDAISGGKMGGYGRTSNGGHA